MILEINTKDNNSTDSKLKINEKYSKNEQVAKFAVICDILRNTLRLNITIQKFIKLENNKPQNNRKKTKYGANARKYILYLKKKKNTKKTMYNSKFECIVIHPI
jgi:hypothetical protein